MKLNDRGDLLDGSYSVDFITSAAPNKKAITKNQPEIIDRIPEIFRQRIAKMLALSLNKGCDALVLGAWRCGVFGNDALTVAQIFGEQVLQGKPYFGRFKCIHFSVLDRTNDQNIFSAFRDTLGNNNS